MIRVIDVIAALFGLIVLFPILIIVAILGLFDTGSPVFVQVRVGKNKQPFKLIKFRTMAVETQSKASHLTSKDSITRLGKVLRKTKLDELPQLINVLKGEMSLVGPRPCLFNQVELIEERSYLGVYEVLPGITGLAQIQNIDMSEPERLASVDKQMIELLSIRNYFYYIFKTISGSGSGDSIES